MKESVEPGQLLDQLRSDAAAQAPDWTVTGNITRAADMLILNVEMKHPASHGLIFSVRSSSEEPREWLRRAIEGSEEIAIVAEAPSLEHRQLVLGLRNLIQAFRWSSSEVRGLVFVLYEAHDLTSEEAAWLAGYCGAGAPMSPQPPPGR